MKAHKNWGKKNNNLIISYVTMRRLIGVLGMMLPLVCVAGGVLFAGTSPQRSISYYYYTNMRDFLVGLLVAVSMFFLTYKGYEKRDEIVTSFIGLAGLGLAFFPIRSADNPYAPAGLFQMNPAIASYVHIASAGIFFILLAFNSIFLFTLSGDGKTPLTRNKKIRNRIHRTCGGFILAALAAFAALWMILGKAALNRTRWVLVLQTVMLLAFGVSWLVKGKTLFRD
ncbi:MAG: DUF998 domain-containing protein [Candidatus Aminicenantales bacterium]